MLKKIPQELGWFFVKLVLAVGLFPFVFTWFDFRSAREDVNQVEAVFLIELGLLIFVGILVALYVLRFLLMLVMKKLGGGSKKAAP